MIHVAITITARKYDDPDLHILFDNYALLKSKLAIHFYLITVIDLYGTGTRYNAKKCNYYRT